LPGLILENRKPALSSVQKGVKNKILGKSGHTEPIMGIEKIP
jgi:hypothetical protein